MKRSFLGVLAFVLAAGTATAQDGPPRAIELGGLETRAAALILSGQEGGEMPLSVLALPLVEATGRGAVPVALVIDVPGAGGALPADAERLVTEVYAYALDADGGVAAFFAQGFALELERWGEVLATGGVKLVAHLDLEPGEYSLRLLVMQRQLDRMALRVVPVGVPPPRLPSLLLPPLFAAEPGRWVVVYEAGDGDPLSPLRAGGRPFVPSTRPVLSGSAPFFLAGRGLGTRLEARVLDAGGDPLRRFQVPTPAVPSGSALELRGTLELDPGDLATGAYLLEVRGVSGAPAAALPLAVLAEPWPGDAAPTWTDLLHAEPVPAEDAQAAAAAELEAKKVEVAFDYAEVLEHLAADPEGTRRALVEHENAALQGGGVREQLELTSGLVELAERLSRPSVDTLLPLVDLYADLYREHHRERRYLLASYTRRVVLRLGEVYAAATDDEGSRLLMAGAVVSLAGVLQEMGSLTGAQALFEHALGIAEHPAALLGLAILRESYGDTDEAVALLRRLVKVLPERAEVRLRLGVNLRRKGSEREARELLKGCLDAPERWVRVVAYEELASLDAAAGRPGDAAALLVRGLEALPGEPQMVLQLAATYDRMERWGEARRVLAGLVPGRAKDADSPRLVYSRRPEWAIDDARRALAAAALVKRPALDAALAKIAGEGGGP